MFSGLGIYIDDHDRFYVSTRSTSQVDTFIQGYFDVQDSYSLGVLVTESPMTNLKRGKIWSVLASKDDTATRLLKNVFEELQRIVGERVSFATIHTIELFCNSKTICG